jgi:methionyl-tRNA synthetase
MNKFYITTPIYYPNARPHLGSAYTTIVCDVLARYKRMCGYDVAFLTGTDEHGEKLERAAAAAGQSPSQFVAEKRRLFVELWEKLGIPVKVYPESDRDSLRFIYTTHPDHAKSVRRMLLRANDYPLRYCANCDLYVHGVAPPVCPKCHGSLESKPVIYKRQYQGRYCVSDERYISDGTDPVNCDVCGRPAELISEENYFFRLSAFEDCLLELYEKHPEFVQPDYRRNEVLSFVKSGLRDISVSRKRIKWGIPFPLDAERNDPEQVVYVWYDALTSYLTGIGFAQGENGGPDFQKYWMGAEGPAEAMHMIGKDILRFHAVYWPAFLMAAGLPLPKTVFAHGWIYYEQDKMSKSKGNVVYPEPIVDALDSFGAPGNDALRYYLLREAPFGQDMSFSYEGLIQRYNSDLANGLGNLANRTITMLNRYFQGAIPTLRVGMDVLRAAFQGDAHALGLVESYPFLRSSGTTEIVDWSDRALGAVNRFGEYEFFDPLALVWLFIGEVNKYLAGNAPWALAERDFQGNRDQIATILCAAAEALRLLALMLAPIMPRSSQCLWSQLGYEGEIKDQRIDQLRWGELRPGMKVGKPEGIFPRLDKGATLARLDEFAEADRNRDKPKEALKSVETEKAPEAPTAPDSRTPSPESPIPSPQPPVPSTAPVPAAESPRISIEDFAKVEMRTGEIKTAERVPGATKLLKLQVDIGSEIRQVVAGIAEYYEPEKLIGMKVVVVTNLQPRKLRGVESNGMIVAASIGDSGRPVLVTFNEDVPNGARLK